MSSNDGWDTMWEDFVFVCTHTGVITLIHPVVKLSLDPRDSKPAKNKAVISLKTISDA